jgi:hypothetical protein
LAEERIHVPLFIRIFLGVGFAISLIDLFTCFMIRFHYFGFFIAIISQLVIDLNIYFVYVRSYRGEYELITKQPLYKIRQEKNKKSYIRYAAILFTQILFFLGVLYIE